MKLIAVPCAKEKIQWHWKLLVGLSLYLSFWKERKAKVPAGKS